MVDSLEQAGEPGQRECQNIYLHDVLDLWFEKRFARSCAGKAYLIRYADDYVACFEYEADANAFLAAMTERLAAFDLEVEPSKTALLRFGSHALGRGADTAAGPRTLRTRLTLHRPTMR